MSNATKTLQKPAWDAKRVGNLLLNNALFILMGIAIVYIAIKNPRFIQPASIINILSQTAAYLPAALGIGGCIVLTGTPPAEIEKLGVHRGDVFFTRTSETAEDVGWSSVMLDDIGEDTADSIKIQTEYKLSLRHQFFGKLGITSIDYDFFRPFQKQKIPRE